jgi:hypothetical protein
MSTLVERLGELLRHPVIRPDDAERAGHAAEALAGLLRAQERAERILAEATGGGADASEGGSLAGKTLQDAAAAVLKEAGGPLHAKELGRRIKQQGWTHPRGKPSRPDQIVYQLAARLPKQPGRFKRVAPNTFALVGQAGGVAPPRKPRVGLFKGPGQDTAREIGESPELPGGGTAWRSS